MLGLLQLSVEGAQGGPDLGHRRGGPEAAIRIFGRHLADALDETLAAAAAVLGAGLRPGHGAALRPAPKPAAIRPAPAPDPAEFAALEGGSEAAVAIAGIGRAAAIAAAQHDAKAGGGFDGDERHQLVLP
jgi:hypothetical protein